MSLIAGALLHDQVIMWPWLDSSYGDGGEKDSVQGNKQTTVATLHLGQYKSQDLRLNLGFHIATGILLHTTACCIATRTQVRLTYNT